MVALCGGNTWEELFGITDHLSHPSRLLFGLEFAFLVWWAPKVKHEGGFPIYYYAVVVLSYALHQVTLTVWGGEVLFPVLSWITLESLQA